MAWTPEQYAKRTKRTKERHGEDVYRKNGTKGGKKSTRGYFGYLKDTDPEKLAQIATPAGLKGGQATAAKRRAAKLLGKKKL